MAIEDRTSIAAVDEKSQGLQFVDLPLGLG